MRGGDTKKESYREWLGMEKAQRVMPIKRSGRRVDKRLEVTLRDLNAQLGQFGVKHLYFRDECSLATRIRRTVQDTNVWHNGNENKLL